MIDPLHGMPTTSARLDCHRHDDHRGSGHLADCADSGRRGLESIDVLYRRHQALVYRYCLGVLRTPEAAEDAAQSTWMHVMVALEAPGLAVRNIRAWLRAIARNQCLDMLRARGAAPTQDISTIEVSSDTTTESDYEIREQLHSLLADLHRLSQRQRSAIVLRELCGLSSGQLAEQFDTTPQRASGLVADARRTLTQRRSGRLLDCEDVLEQLEQGAGRAGGLRAHLDICESCDSAERRRSAKPDVTTAG